MSDLIGMDDVFILPGHQGDRLRKARMSPPTSASSERVEVLGLLCGQLTRYMNAEYAANKDTGVIRHVVEMLLGLTSQMPDSLSILHNDHVRISRDFRLTAFLRLGSSPSFAS